MVLEFVTNNRNIYGYRKYILIDTEKKRFTRTCNRLAASGIGIKTSDYKQLVETLQQEGYREYIRL